MSRPALNARVPAARSTTAWTDSSSLTLRHAAAISSHIVRLNALSRSGRFSVMVATWSSASTSNRIVSKLVIGSPSPTLPIGGSFLHEGFRTFERIFGVQIALAERLGQYLRFVQWKIQPLEDREPCSPHCQRGVRVDDVRDLVGSFEKAVVLDDLADQAEL